MLQIVKVSEGFPIEMYLKLGQRNELQQLKIQVYYKISIFQLGYSVISLPKDFIFNFKVVTNSLREGFQKVLRIFQNSVDSSFFREMKQKTRLQNIIFNENVQSKELQKQLDVFELKELGKQDGESQLDQLTSQAQAQIQHFEKVCNDINEKITHYGSSKGMDDIQKSVKEAQNDLHQMEIIIQNMGSIQISKNTENQKKQQTLQKLIKIVQNSKENLKLITYQLAQKHQTSQIQAKQPAKGRHGDNQINIQLLEEDFDYGYDELYIQSRNQQIMEIAQVINQINEMMQEAAKMIKEQGEQIKIIRINIKDAKTKTDGAAEETKKAAQASKGNNDRTLYFCGIITLLQNI